MIKKISISNFKSFGESFVFDLMNTNGYTFNSNSVKNDIVNHSIIYGKNGIGKSNLGFAIFDLISHLTDYYSNQSEYTNYLNAYGNSDVATFEFQFQFDSNEVVYEYSKTDLKTIVSEKISINGKELAKINRKVSDESDILFQGAENLNKNLSNKNLSLLKYIKNNTLLDKNEENEVLLEFFEFVDGMLFFRSLDKRNYLGLETRSRDIQEDIIQQKNVSDLERFLNDAGIQCKLKIVKESEKEIIAFDFNNDKTISFFRIASTGTVALTLFYFWLQRLRVESKVSFLFIDEFDAFYHHELSELIVKELKKTGVQFILTTHNTSIMTNDLLRPDCYFLMDNNRIQSFSKRTKKELREAHNIEKMYKAGTFNE